MHEACVEDWFNLKLPGYINEVLGKHWESTLKLPKKNGKGLGKYWESILNVPKNYL